MLQLGIHHLHTRLRLAPGATALPRRLQRLQAEVTGGALEAALQRLGLDGLGELCLRRVEVPPLCLDLSAPDPVLVAHWARSWADAIVQRAARRDAGVVHYGSRAQALADLVVAATAGDFGRAWAWRQLGLWPAEAAVTGADAAGLVLRALQAEPGAAVPALVQLARRPAAFQRWWRQASAPGLLALAQGVLRRSGGTGATTAVAAAQAATPPVLQALLQRSRLARLLAREGAHGSAEGGAGVPSAGPSGPRERAAALLVVAECEPAWLAAPVAELAALLEGLEAGLAAPVGAAPRRPSPAAPRVLQPPAPASTGCADRPVDRPDAGTVDRVAGVESRVEQRRQGRTGYGGLIFLLNLAQPLGWPAAWLADPLLAARGARWCLHRLALQMLSLEADDPAALAFAGLLPGDEPPSADGAPIRTEEEALLAHQWRRLLQALRQRLQRSGGAGGAGEAGGVRGIDEVDPADDATLLAWVCRRQARIVADPGWLEVQLSLDEVSLPLRAAGLDRDPGWLPWLGLVVKFVYE